MVLLCCRYVDDFPAKSLYQCEVFMFRVDDDNICIRGKGRKEDPILCCKRFAVSRHAKNEGITVLQLPSVGYDGVLADDVLSVINAAFMPHILHVEGYLNDNGFRCKGTERFHQSGTENTLVWLSPSMPAPYKTNHHTAPLRISFPQTAFLLVQHQQTSLI